MVNEITNKKYDRRVIITDNRKDFNRHINTRKHKKMDRNIKTPKNIPIKKRDVERIIDIIVLVGKVINGRVD